MGIPNLGAVGAHVKPVTVYVLVDPRDSSPFYVGVTTRGLGTRLSSHINDSVHLNMRGARYDVIRHIHECGAKTEIFDIETVPHDGWVEAEQFWIEYFRFIGANLTNAATGGPGATGTRQTSKTQEKRRAAAAGRDMSHLHTPEVRGAAMSSVRHRIVVDGVEYSGIKAASRELGIGYGALHYRLDVGLATRITPRRNDNVRVRKGLRSGASHPNSRAVIIDGIEYVTIREACALLGLNASTINRRLASGCVQYADGGAPPKGPKKPVLKGRPRGALNYKSRPVIVEGIRYSCAVDAVIGSGVSKVTIWRWLKSGRAQYADKAPL